MHKKKLALIIVVLTVSFLIYIVNSQKANIVEPTIDNIAIENKGSDEAIANSIKNAATYIEDEEASKTKSILFPKSKELTGISGYINTDPEITISGNKGNVVLIDFWTYTCINCIRTQPYLNQWHEKYNEDGLVIIGVHTPEFEFEKNYDNVKKAVEKAGIKYAVVQDNNYATWRAYNNRWWPRKFLIDIDGYIRYDHIGEGAYDETERTIQTLLEERMDRLGKQKLQISEGGLEIKPVAHGLVNTPEIYFGYGFARGNFGNPEGLPPEQIVEYKIPFEIESNKAYLEGTWKINKDDSELLSDEGMIILPYSAKVVNIVAGSQSGSELEILIDENPLTAIKMGLDTDEKSRSSVRDFTLYNLVDYEYGEHTIQIKIKGKGFKINTFTFG
jgi:thiol-disulfide isomerase/thioredoxin